MSKVVKGIGKAVGSVISGATKVFKSVVSSKIGKIALLAAVIYISGGALGAWETPFSSINGIFASGAAEAAAAPGTAAGFLTEGTAAAPLAAAGEAVTAPIVSVASPVATELAAAGAAQTAPLALNLAPTAGIVGSGPLGAPLVSAAAPASGGGLISSAMNIAKGVGEWVQGNPIPAIIGGSMLASSFTPDQIDVLEKQGQISSEKAQALRDEIARNTAVGGVNLGVSVPSVQMPLQRLTGGPAFNQQGMINRAM